VFRAAVAAFFSRQFFARSGKTQELRFLLFGFASFSWT